MPVIPALPARICGSIGAVVVATLGLASGVGCAGDNDDAPTGRIVFASPEILLVPAAGGKPERFRIADRELWDVAFSADGRQVAFNSLNGIEASGITVMAVKDKSFTVVPHQPPQEEFASYDVAWAPDGTKLAFVNGDGVFVISIDGTGLRRIGRGSSPTWTADSEHVVFASGDNRGVDFDIAFVRVDGAGRRILGPGRHPDVSPSGDEVAFSTAAGVFVRPISGGESRLVVPKGFGPGWSPDGRFLAFTRYTECGHAACSGRVFVVPVEGGEPRAIGPTIFDPGPPGQWISDSSAP